MIIGLTGGRGVGKSTVANYLCNNYAFIKAHPFDGGKAMCKTYYMRLGIDENTAERMINSDLKDGLNPLLPYGQSSRYFMEHLGKFLPTLGLEWTLGTELKILQDKYGSDRNIVVESIVYEDTVLKEHGGIIIRIINNRADITGDFTDEYQAKIEEDHIIYNNDDMTELYYRVDSMMAYLTNKGDDSYV